MIDFAIQKQLLEPLMRDPRNRVCADCDAIAPTWVSLDFGVFLCSNCSGSHRGLGPTITRVRSATLDKWEREWVNNMLLGNTDINKYWEGDSKAKICKPNGDSSLQEISRYVFQKYIKKKFVIDPSQPDPLTSYKNGNATPISNKTTPVLPQPAPKVQPKPIQVTVAPAVSVPKQEVSLLDFDVEPPQQLTPVPTQTSQTAQAEEQDEFTDFSEAGSAAPQLESSNGEAFLSFDALMNSQKQVQQQSQANVFQSHYNQAHQQSHYMGHGQHNYAYPPHHGHGSFTPQYMPNYQPQSYLHSQQGAGYGQLSAQFQW